MTDNDQWDDYESGPFCRHWYSPEDCTTVCAHCGHACNAHEYASPCSCFDCDCPEWVEPDE